MIPPEPVTPIKYVDGVYENAGIEQEIINSYTGDPLIGGNSPTLNITNFFSDYDAVAEAPFYRTSEKESKGAENFAIGKPRYYPTAYTVATMELIVQPEPDELVDPPADPALMYYVYVAIGDGNPEDHTVSWILEIYETNSENGYPVFQE